MMQRVKQIWITNGDINKRIKTTDNIPDNWRRGRCNVHSDESKKKISESHQLLERTPHGIVNQRTAKRLKTMEEKYGSTNIWEINGEGLRVFYENQNILKKQEPFNKKSKSFKRLQITEEQDNKCLNCGMSEWLGSPMKFELDHVDGDTSNNERTNLRLLCPNCHSLTETWRKKKK